MEFYGIFNEPKIWPVEMFQFPTGWNSTRFFFIGTEHFLAFQFPTGWNSTGAQSKNWAFFQRFNSQRDGILPLFARAARHFDQSFNSQRDGILPSSPKASFLKTQAFQFPTGWNSTYINAFNAMAEKRFNSQRDGILHTLKISSKFLPVCFNSQRDGILQPFFVLDFDDSGGFNSQRDRILPKSASKFSHIFCTFQFPTGWNSTKHLRR